ncbi:hypothetical protein E2C01_039284 [Portunus trituberculatus]|uniref:Uncharacterized protein n=1 Tax=Portunus trituberculatus TaxID=210409 RepID=A0A5B7FD87_PORTR|nr:hypothetical protein [Portunus trituberculatus]
MVVYDKAHYSQYKAAQDVRLIGWLRKGNKKGYGGFTAPMGAFRRPSGGEMGTGMGVMGMGMEGMVGMAAKRRMRVDVKGEGMGGRGRGMGVTRSMGNGRE